ncbi:MAG: hypothetical protein QOH48_160 [Actinomycetota bacterium]|nr:hypothetical protein [Actinomycetota bacterium]
MGPLRVSAVAAQHQELSGRYPAARSHADRRAVAVRIGVVVGADHHYPVSTPSRRSDLLHAAGPNGNDPGSDRKRQVPGGVIVVGAIQLGAMYEVAGDRQPVEGLRSGPRPFVATAGNAGPRQLRARGRRCPARSGDQSRTRHEEGRSGARLFLGELVRKGKPRQRESHGQRGGDGQAQASWPRRFCPPRCSSHALIDLPGRNRSVARPSTWSGCSLRLRQVSPLVRPLTARFCRAELEKRIARFGCRPAGPGTRR